MRKGVAFGIILLLLLPLSIAEEKYSFEKAEELTPLIEWRDYSQETFDEALEKNKPIFMLLTAPSWCYWCQVYESEDYLFHPDMVSYVNENVIPIYVDADKRQDLTRQYLEGGWPSTTILTPQRERLLGYSGPRPVENMIANLQNAVSHANSNVVLSTRNPRQQYTESEPIIPSPQNLANLYNGYVTHIVQTYDPVHGGFGNGQKFPQGRALDLALELYEKTDDSQFLLIVEHTLENQYTKIEELETNYNLFDPIDGGFHRYGVQRDWSPPHYEKMLYDNARLLLAYHHLTQINEENKLAKEVVEKTLQFIDDNWYDFKEGGFYGNSDVHGEDAYFGQNPRPKEKPRVEKTKYSNWNGDAILTYLYIGETNKAKKSLDFFSKHMIDENGAYHYYSEGDKGVQGNLFDNAYLFLAFTQAAVILEDENYLQTAQFLADYMLEDLYDWYGGGFFERNSKDKDLYAHGEEVLFGKSVEENGISAFAMLNLYQATGKIEYLNAGIKTIAATIQDVGGLDRGYYHAKSAEYIVENNLLDVYLNSLEEIEQIEKERQENFWANEYSTKLQKKEFVSSEEGLEKIDAPILILIIISLIAGFISFASPCSLPIVPAYLAYSFQSSKKNLKGMTLSFFLGLAIVFTLLGMSATVIGKNLRSYSSTFSSIAGIVIFLFGVMLIVNKGFSGFKIKTKKPTTYVGSFFFGCALGISWTPCVGPILVSLLVLASTNTSVIVGGTLLFFYAVGISLPLLIVSTYIEKINKKSKLWKIIEGKELTFKLGKKKHTINSNTLFSGIMFILLGYLMYTGLLFSFNQYVTQTGIQKIIFAIEEWLLKLVR